MATAQGVVQLQVRAMVQVRGQREGRAGAERASSGQSAGQIEWHQHEGVVPVLGQWHRGRGM